ncbi:P-loop containing nucleoside triphosphate hydrolase protein [Cristinia sonorae]|uniref:P-loop containing nucleoside triphosphate hydrolase protein n=1 Tax=Cristinia sonorae TaxID=1940300 RepID=A0A8K0UFI8_9AGAR|nr:P-loop containing nucleoside triphosphate hydrolase protein [Cristinia sonorae]
MADCAQDRSFGPASTCRTMDFTVFFEQSILSLTPDVIFLVLAMLRLTYLSRQSSKLSRHGAVHLAVKMIVGVLVLLVSSVASLVYLHRASTSTELPGLFVWIAAPALQLVAVIMLGVVVVAEHYRSVTPSVLVICYALVKGLFTATALRTYQLGGLIGSDNNVDKGIIWAEAFTCAAYFVLCFSELVEKRRLLKDKTLPPVATASFISRSLYFWLLPLLWTGRKKVLTIEDLGTVPPELRADASGTALYSSLSRTKKGANYLLFATMKAFGLKLFAPAVPRLVLLLATYAQPLLVNKTVQFVADTSKPTEEGWALVFDATVLYRGALVGNIYSKSLKLSSHTSRSMGGGVASTYMSVDVERVCQGTEFFHEMWASLASVGLSVAILYTQATWPAFLPLAVTAILLAIASRVSKRVGASQKLWLAATDKRVKFISSIINNLLPIKWSSYESVLAKRVAELRANEMKQAKKFYIFTSVAGALSLSASPICILAVLGPYAAIAARTGRPPLESNNLFTIVTTLNLLNLPLNMLGQFLPIMAASYASVKRIEEFLLKDEKPADSRTFFDHSNANNEDVKDDSEKDDVLELSYGDEKPRVTEEPSIEITMNSTSFAWAPDADAFLQDLTMNLSEQRLYMCVGPVASGKTLLLLSILGETICKSGSYLSPPVRIAYAAQDALIVPGTVRENITFGCEFDEDWYNRVVDACALRPDLKKMRAGDGTMLGEKGRRLSGGQKQRIALARAVYARAPWTLLDDPLSALDAETEAHVFDSLFGAAGLLKNRAVLLVTHNIKLLEHAHHILVLNEGKIQYQGNLNEITQAGYDLNSRLALPDGGISEEKGRVKVIIEPGEEHVDEQEAEEPAIAQESLGFTPYLFWARNATWVQFVLAVSIIMLGGLVRIGLQAFLRAWADAKGKNQGEWIGAYAGFTAVLLLTNAFGLWQFTTILAAKAGIGLHNAELKGLLAAAPSYIMATSAGRIINRFSQDIFVVDFEFPMAFLNALVQGSILIGSIIYMLIPAPWLTLSLIPLSLFYYGSLTLYVGTSKQLQHLQAASKSPLYTVFSTTLTGLETIRALRVEEHFKKQNDAFLDRSQKPFFYRFGGIRFLRTILSFIAFVVAVGLSALAIGLRHATSPAFLGLALSNLANLSFGLSNLLISMAQAENGSVSISRVHEISNLPAEEETATVMTPMEKGTWPRQGSVKFENLQMRYKSDLDLALRGVSFSIKAGQRVGICGRTGSGKSSLILALFRAMNRSLTAGRISIDETDIQDVPLTQLRESLSLVAQEPFLWHSSLRDNLDPLRELQDSDIWTALKQVGTHDAVSALPDRLDMVVEDGGSFSRGQRQLLCLARVLLRRRKIVILDEASSSLDLETDEKMREVIRSELADCTVIAVAHRLATIIDFDMILVMDEGVVVESGTPRELLARPTSRFALLAASQGLL